MNFARLCRLGNETAVSVPVLLVTLAVRQGRNHGCKRILISLSCITRVVELLVFFLGAFLSCSPINGDEGFGLDSSLSFQEHLSVLVTFLVKSLAMRPTFHEGPLTTLEALNISL